MIVGRIVFISERGGTRSTEEASWTVGQHVERLMLHLGHGSYKNSSHEVQYTRVYVFVAVFTYASDIAY